MESKISLLYKGLHTGNQLPKGVGFEEGNYWIHCGKEAEISGVGKIKNGDWLIYKFEGWVITTLNNNDTDNASHSLEWNIQ